MRIISCHFNVKLVCTIPLMSGHPGNGGGSTRSSRRVAQFLSVLSQTRRLWSARIRTCLVPRLMSACGCECGTTADCHSAQFQVDLEPQLACCEQLSLKATTTARRTRCACRFHVQEKYRIHNLPRNVEKTRSRPQHLQDIFACMIACMIACTGSSLGHTCILHVFGYPDEKALR
jgi:hypothetical protein